jgi:hypothetical protein
VILIEEENKRYGTLSIRRGMSKRRVCQQIYEIFPDINKKFVEKDVDVELEANGDLEELALQVLTSRYVEMENYPKEGQAIVRRSHYKCRVCGQFCLLIHILNII